MSRVYKCCLNFGLQTPGWHQLHENVIYWCHCNCKGNFYIDSLAYSTEIVFASKQDLIAFKLWCDKII